MKMVKMVLNKNNKHNEVYIQCGCTCACSFLKLFEDGEDTYLMDIYSNYYNKKYDRLVNKFRLHNTDACDALYLLNNTFKGQDDYSMTQVLDDGVIVEYTKYASENSDNDIVIISFYISENSFVNEKPVYGIVVDRQMLKELNGIYKN
jgi:hypothetical protein